MERLKKSKKVLVLIGGIFLVGVIGLVYSLVGGQGFGNIKNILGLGGGEEIAEVSNLTNSNRVNGIVYNNDEKNSEDIDKESENSEAEFNENTRIFVHIIGEVKNSGLVELEQGQRIVDAIEKAGGVTEIADLNKVNLAFVLSDGQKVRIPSIYDEENVIYVTDESGNNVILDSGKDVDNNKNSESGGSKTRWNSRKD